jgi:hypothetical protein
MIQQQTISPSLTREQLYHMVWEEPTRVIAPRLGLSDVGLAKVCRKLHIPRPWRGYWRERETGYRPRQPKLPLWPAHLGKEPSAITFQPRTRTGATPEPHPAEPDTVQQQRVYESLPQHRLDVAAQLSESDRLVRRAARLLKRTGNRNLLRPGEWPCLDIKVTKTSLDRALRIFDTILKGLHARRWMVVTQEKHPFETQVKVLDEVLSISISEKVRQVERPQSPRRDTPYIPFEERYSYESTGTLTLRIAPGPSSYANARSWTDGKRRRIESCLNDVMIGFVQLAEGQKAQRREAEQRRLDALEAERRRLIVLERMEREKDRREELQRQAQSWGQTQQLRDYVSALREAARAHLQAEPDGRLARWIRWAEAYITELDPLQRAASLPQDPSGYGRRPFDLEEFGLNRPPG